MPVMLASLASEVAASSDDRLVASPKSIITRVNPNIFGTSIPS